MTQFVRVGGRLVNAAQREQIIESEEQTALRWCRVTWIGQESVALMMLQHGAPEFVNINAYIPRDKKAPSKVHLAETEGWYHVALGWDRRGNIVLRGLSYDKPFFSRDDMETRLGTVSKVEHNTTRVNGRYCEAPIMHVWMEEYGARGYVQIPCLWQESITKETTAERLVGKSVSCLWDPATGLKGISTESAP